MIRRDAAAISILLSLFAARFAAGQSRPGRILDPALFPAPGTYGHDISLPVPNLGEPEELRFAFADGAVLPFDRSLRLGAFEREERNYSITLTATKDGGSEERLELSYTIDKRPPAKPSFSPSSGEYPGELLLNIAGEGVIRYAVSDGKGLSEFAVKAPGTGIRLKASEEGTTTWTVYSYAVDAAGNKGDVAQAVYRMIPRGLTPSYRKGEAEARAAIVALAKKPEGVSASVDTAFEGVAILSVKGQGQLAVAVNTSGKFPEANGFYLFTASEPGMDFRLSAPYGDLRTLYAFVGTLRGEEIRASPEPIAIRVSQPRAIPLPKPPVPAAPKVEQGGGGILLSWLDAGMPIWFTVDGAAPIRYDGPAFIPSKNGREISIGYFSGDPYGDHSDSAVTVVKPAVHLDPPRLSGVDDGGVYGKPMKAEPPQGVVVRFRITDDGSEPPPVDASSPLMKGLLSFPGIEGKTVVYRVRMISYLSDAAGSVKSEERFLRLAIDREPPAPPVLTRSGPKDPADSDVMISFRKDSDEVYFAVAEDNAAAANFVRYDAPIRLSGPDEGRKRFTVRAYSVDPYGNRSAEMLPAVVLVDKSSIYVAEWGRPGARGTPDDPESNLDAAIAAAQARGKKLVYVNGRVTLRNAVSVTSDVTVTGGFDRSWGERSGERGFIDMRVANTTARAMISVTGAVLKVQACDVAAAVSGAQSLFEGSNARLAFSDLSLRVSGGVESVLVRASGSDVSVSRCRMAIEAAVTGRGFDLKTCNFSLEDSSLYCDQWVRLFDAFRLSDGEASVARALLESNAVQFFSGFSVSGGKLAARRMIVRSAKRGTAETRFLSADTGARVTLDTVYAELNASSNLVAIRLADSEARVYHATVFLDSRSTMFMDAANSAYTVANSIIEAADTGGNLVNDTSLPRAESFSSSCIWGFPVFLSGAARCDTLDSFNRLMGSGAYPCIAEATGKTFLPIVKGLRKLSPGSACVDTSRPLADAAKEDMDGEVRPSTSGSMRADIGADEY